MLYNQFKDKNLSALGFGTMRLPVIDGDNAKIDEQKTFELIDKAMECGVNYYDTAWPYHSGNSEIVIGKALNRHPRSSYYLATKFPSFQQEYFEKKEEIFARQLEKTGHDFFDFYLLHNVADKNIDNFMDPKYSVVDFLLGKKAEGKIKHLGFSTHASIPQMERFLASYGKYMEFCQIQLNWFDWEFQDAKRKVEILESYNIPVWVMEPVRGGKLAQLDERYSSQLKALRPDESIAAWSFRFLQSIPSVTMVLSGMGNMEMVEDNIRTFETYKPVSESEKKLLLDFAHEMSHTVPCTSCRYCTKYCPQGLEIPELIAAFNQASFTGYDWSVKQMLGSLEEGKRPSDCLSCGSCEQQCPQNIKISEVMKNLADGFAKACEA